MGPYLGDFLEDETVHFLWDSNSAAGASITRATNGTISVYKDNGVAQSVAGVTDTEDFDGLTGIHAVTIDLSADAFYAIGANYTVVLSGATIDGQTVNAVLAHFSIENRFQEVDVTRLNGTALGSDGPIPLLGIIDKGTAQAATASTVTLRAAATFADSVLFGATILVFGSTQGYWQQRTIIGNVSATDVVTVSPAFDVTPTGTITYLVLASAPAVTDPSSLPEVLVADGAISSATFGANAITSNVMADGTITKNKFADGAEPASKPGHTAKPMDKIDYLFARIVNKSTFNKDTGAWALRNAADDADIETRTDSNDGTTYTKAAD